jgi:hypothetical protein
VYPVGPSTNAGCSFCDQCYALLLNSSTKCSVSCYGKVFLLPVFWFYDICMLWGQSPSMLSWWHWGFCFHGANAWVLTCPGYEIVFPSIFNSPGSSWVSLAGEEMCICSFRLTRSLLPLINQGSHGGYL